MLRHTARWFPLFAVLLLAGQGPSALASGELRIRDVKPNAQLGTDGYRLEVDTRWADGGGYRPLRVRITPKQASTTDTRFTLRVGVRSGRRYYGGRRHSIEVEQDVIVPPAKVDATGSFPTTEAIVSVPQLAPWWETSVEVWVDGEHDKDLSMPPQGMTNALNWDYDGAFPDEPMMLIVDSNTPRSTLARTSQFAFRGGRSGSGMNSFQLTPGLLPQRWIDFTSLDVVCMSADELKAFAADKTQQKRWRAIRSWVAAGGNLWIFGGGDTNRFKKDAPWRNLSAIETALGFPPPGDAGETSPMKRGWQWNNEFLQRPLGLGQTLVHSSVQDPTRISRFGWSLLGALGEGGDRLQWAQRHGLSLTDENDTFWEFLIPGVGRVPVTMFQLLITLFVVVIGPVNYVLLRKRGKLHLLIVTVPACAVLVTLGLFGYALLTDGLGVRVRARTLTHIDQRRGEAACWSRLSYYAGLAPSGGLKFPQDVCVLPMEDDNDEGNSQQRELIWDGGNAQLRSGWIQSREPAQFVTLRARPSQARLEIAEPAGGQVRVTNQLGAPIQHLVLCDSKGDLHYASDMPPEDSQTLRHITGGASQLADVRKLFAANRPRRPKGMENIDPSSGRRNWFRRKRVYVSFNTSLLEQGLEGAQKFLSGPRPRTYLAIVDRSPEVEFGVESFSEEASFHVVLGEW